MGGIPTSTSLYFYSTTVSAIVYTDTVYCIFIRINTTSGIKIIPKNHGKCANTNATTLLITSAMPHPAKMDMVTAVVKMKADKNTIHRCFNIFSWLLWKILCVLVPLSFYPEILPGLVSPG